MTPQEAVAAVDFWTVTVAETQALGSDTSPELAQFFGANISTPRCYWSDPNGPRNWEIRVGRWITPKDEETGQLKRDETGAFVQVENPLYTLVIEEIARRKEAV